SLQQPAFILEEKAPVEPSRGDGAGGEARSLSPGLTLPLTQAESLGPWQSESLLAESWSTMGDVDPEDAKSLDSTNGTGDMGLHPPSILAPMAAEPPIESLEQLKFTQIPLSDVEEHSVEASQAAPEKPESTTLPKTTKPLSSTELLFGGAALVAVVGVVAYGAVAYCRK
ncbi:hypothetical protein GBF38_001458, partial [Nibea albiflora]